MNHIYHEKQDGALCGQHCINNLLQFEYFTAVDLATIAQQMDHEEKSCMAESGTDSTEFQRFLEQPSSNMDDSGMFSIQVLTAALKIVELTLVNISSTHPLASIAQKAPSDLRAYVCNFHEHWFTIRKIGKQWFNLNSLLTFPELLSDMYISLFLKQLQHEGYSIFIVEGELPQSEADNVLNFCVIEQIIKPQLINSNETKVTEDSELEAALKASLDGIDKKTSYSVEKTPSQLELEAAIRMSLAAEDSTSSEDSDYQKVRLLSMGASASGESSKQDSDLQKALQLSLDSSLCDVQVPENPFEPDLEDIRRKRLAKLCKK